MHDPLFIATTRHTTHDTPTTERRVVVVWSGGLCRLLAVEGVREEWYIIRIYLYMYIAHTTHVCTWGKTMARAHLEDATGELEKRRCGEREGGGRG